MLRADKKEGFVRSTVHYKETDRFQLVIALRVQPHYKRPSRPSLLLLTHPVFTGFTYRCSGYTHGYNISLKPQRSFTYRNKITRLKGNFPV